MAPLLDRVLNEIAERGPLTVARFMELALYDPEHGFYATASRRSGTGGDFYTSVDVGTLFGRLIARLVSHAWSAMGQPAGFDLVEAGAGNGRLMRDVLDTLEREDAACYRSLQVTLVERSPAGRLAQEDMLRTHAGRTVSADSELPSEVEGLIFANELLDAFPVHRVSVSVHGWREHYVAADAGALFLKEGDVSTPRLREYLAHVEAGGVSPGLVADISLESIEWCQRAARALGRGYLLLIDYGHEDHQLYGAGTGTLRAYARHHVDPLESSRLAAGVDVPSWLLRPGEQDITADVDFTAIEQTLAREGLVRQAFVDQTRFLLALGLARILEEATDPMSLDEIRMRLAATALVSPEGLGGSHRCLVMSRKAPAPPGLPFDRPWPADSSKSGD